MGLSCSAHYREGERLKHSPVKKVNKLTTYIAIDVWQHEGAEQTTHTEYSRRLCHHKHIVLL